MEPAISPQKPINRPLKIDRYNQTTQNRLITMAGVISKRIQYAT